jgi:hypothetical protein
VQSAVTVPLSHRDTDGFVALVTAPVKSLNATNREKSSTAWQDELWRRWPREEDWPARLDVYEAAAYLRLSPDSIRRALVQARDGRAKLAHQRIGSIYRIRRVDLDTFGKVEAR